MKKLLLSLFVLSSVLLAKEVTVSILPQKYFVEKIAGDKIDVNVMVRAGFSPATYEPKTSQMRKLSKSLAYFSIGVPFEKVWLEKFQNANKKMLLVDTSKGIKKLEMDEHSHGEEEHEDHKEHIKHNDHDEHKHEKHEDHDEHENHKEHTKHDKHEDHDEDNEHTGHDHGGLDPHIWLDPVLVKTQAKTIYKTLVSLDGKNKEYYKNNYENFLRELNILDLTLKKQLDFKGEKAFMVFHPSWGYFAKRYNLEQIAIEIQGKEPKPAQLIELVKEAKLHNIKIVFVAPQFSKKGAKTISKSINGIVTVIDPLAYEWADNLLKSAKEIRRSYK